MNQYECPHCSRNVIIAAKTDKHLAKCCKGETPVEFRKRGTSIVVAAAKLPDEGAKVPQGGIVSGGAPAKPAAAK